MQQLGKILLFTGIILVIAGAIIVWGGSKFKWLGNLPGDIKIQKPSFTFYAPITTMIIISLLISLIIWLIKRFL